MMDFRTGAHPAASTALEISPNRLRKQGKRMAEEMHELVNVSRMMGY
jgi:hypothetical protein